jgi:hypothetical protein
MSYRVAVVGSLVLAVLAGCKEDTASRSTATIGVAAYTSAPANAVGYGCQARSTRFPWGKLELRTWTPRRAFMIDHPEDAPGTLYGSPFSARLVQAYGADFGSSRRTVILEMEDGCRRQFRTESFLDADNALIEAEMAKRPMTPDPATYRISYSDPLTSPDLVASGQLRLYETQHFAFWYGNGTDSSYDFARTIARKGRTMEQVLRETGEWLERVWLINRDVIGAPMPFANSADKQKLNVYLCGTGRPNADGDRGGCGAAAAAEMGISAWALDKGSEIISHELGHMIQYYTGGFQNSESAGPIWETGANWNAFAISPSWVDNPYYFDNLENGPLFSLSRYDAFPFMNYLYENDRMRSLVFDAWKTTVSRGASSSVTRDFVETLIQVGQKSGAFPQGLATFADDMGWYGARLAAMDFFNQRALIDGYRATPTTHRMGSFYTPLIPATSNGALFTPPTERPLLEWGTHLVPMIAGAKTVTVTLTGKTIANSAAWRFSIVAVKDGDVPVYSALGKAVGVGSGSTSLAVPSGSKLYLAVTATPYKYQSLGWQMSGAPIFGVRFPYEVKIEGATPRMGPVGACDVEAAPGQWTYNYSLNNNTDNRRRC